MAYEMEDIRTGQEIFYYLLEHHEMSEEARLRPRSGCSAAMRRMSGYRIW